MNNNAIDRGIEVVLKHHMKDDASILACEMLEILKAMKEQPLPCGCYESEEECDVCRKAEEKKECKYGKCLFDTYGKIKIVKNDPIREVYEKWKDIDVQDELGATMYKPKSAYVDMWNAIKKYCEEEK